MKKSALCFLATIILVGGCGTRRVDLTKREIKKDTLISLISEKKTKVDSSYTFDFSSFKIRPIDLNKPIIVDGHAFHNALIEGSTKKGTGTLKKEECKKNTDMKKGASHSRGKSKISKKSDHTILRGLISFIFFGFLFLYFYLPRIKKVNTATKF